MTPTVEVPARPRMAPPIAQPVVAHLEGLCSVAKPHARAAIIHAVLAPNVFDGMHRGSRMGYERARTDLPVESQAPYPP